MNSHEPIRTVISARHASVRLRVATGIATENRGLSCERQRSGRHSISLSKGISRRRSGVRGNHTCRSGTWFWHGCFQESPAGHRRARPWELSDSSAIAEVRDFLTYIRDMASQLRANGASADDAAASIDAAARARWTSWSASLDRSSGLVGRAFYAASTTAL